MVFELFQKLHKPIHDIADYSTSICPFVPGKCGKEGKKLQKFEYLENKVLEGLSFGGKTTIWWKIADKSFKLIRHLKIQTAHGHDDISIWMTKICNSALVKPLSQIFQNCLNCSTLPDIWQKWNNCPVDKKLTNKLLTITDLFYYGLYLGKYFEKTFIYINLFLNILMKTNCSQNINLVSDQMIHGQINYCLSLKKKTCL